MSNMELLEGDSKAWWSRVKEINAVALRNGSLKKIETTAMVEKEAGIEWIVRVASSLKEKPSSETQKKDFDPFLPPEKDLFITEIGENHNLMLNKFNVNDYHMIVATKKFEKQEDFLNPIDFSASFFCIKTFDLLAFFNCGKSSGASQPHKHFQFLPLPYEESRSGDFPIEPLLVSNSQNVEDEKVFSIQELPFKHACLKLSQSKMEKMKSPENGVYLEQMYRHLLKSSNISEETQEKSHNAIWTKKWMIVIPRQKEKSDPPTNLSLNSIAFTGTILTKTEESAKVAKEVGALKILESVCFKKQ